MRKSSGNHPGRCFPIILARGPNRAPWEPDGADPHGASRVQVLDLDTDGLRYDP